MDTTGSFHPVDLLRPVPRDLGPARRRLLVARQAVALVGTCVTLVGVVVWLVIAILGGGLDAPWWLWTAVPTAVAVAALTGLDRVRAAGGAA